MYRFRFRELKTVANDPEHHKAASPKGGRPRSVKLHRAILGAAVDQVLSSGFRSLSIDAIAAEAAVGQMRTMARAFRGKDGALIRAFPAEAQFNPELAKALHDRWTMPRRRMAVEYFHQGY